MLLVAAFVNTNGSPHLPMSSVMTTFEAGSQATTLTISGFPPRACTEAHTSLCSSFSEKTRSSVFFTVLMGCVNHRREKVGSGVYGEGWSEYRIRAANNADWHLNLIEGLIRLLDVQGKGEPGGAACSNSATAIHRGLGECTEAGIPAGTNSDDLPHDPVAITFTSLGNPCLVAENKPCARQKPHIY